MGAQADAGELAGVTYGCLQLTREDMSYSVKV